VLLVAFALAGRERGFPVIVLALLGAQAGLHFLFEAVPHEMVMSGGAMVAPPSATAMTCAHLAAGLFTAAWLRGGEAAAWRLCRWVARSVRPLLQVLWTLVRLLVVAPFRAGLGWVAERPFAVPVPLWHSVIRRGPPAGAYVLV
jgi:hypothetical protein